MTQTKYELMAELRQLNRGFPRIAISTLKKHEIEARIDALKKYKAQEEESGKLFSPHKPGPLGPRKIPAPEQDEDDIKVPGVPPTRVSEYSMKKARKAEREENEDFLQNTLSYKMPVNPAPKIVKKPAKVVKMDDSVNPELVRTKSKPVTYEPDEPKCPRCGSTKYHTH